ncbi:FG-GAP repeat domain-containing protein [Siphonobacter curvatus]|uniref:Cytochrome c domain-containing protein n=1 Tax=Siphonobacter curvatus TaxID=2094562 RepID=A0A2S7IPA6_9BACT|nr:VCBS repeat-containing protein [Siphonobacter curvatus]PQA59468.1 hypothetical protein C5O19_07410 [Siphonobacter curvatus]
MQLLKSLLLVGVVVVLFSQATFSPKNQSLLSDSLLTGEQLAHRYCQGCHLFPDPSLLDKQTWEKGVLPYMGRRLGIRSSAIDPYRGLFAEEKQKVMAAGLYPRKPLLSKADWQKIVSYYRTQAPEKLAPPRTVTNPYPSLPNFSVRAISFQDDHTPQTTLLTYDTLSHQLFVGDRQKKLWVLDSEFKLQHEHHLDSPPSALRVQANGELQVLTMGSLMPSDLNLGNLLCIDSGGAIRLQLHSLPRPVHFTECDLNQDGKKDVIVCGFGHQLGQLAWYESYQESNPVVHILKALPGARKAVVEDFNRDGRPDIVVLMEQAQEGVYLFTNEGQGEFREQALLQFPPVYGLSSMEVLDFNGDGYLDLLVSNGDNWDYTNILKNYHGIRLYLNDGENHFKEAWFYPLYGANQVVAADFDQDGDLDLAAISFFPDMIQHPEQGFMYFNNLGNLNFEAHTVPEAAKGKWLTMEVADYDQDGDLDLILGSYLYSLMDLGTLTLQGQKKFPQLLILNNGLRQPAP